MFWPGKNKYISHRSSLQTGHTYSVASGLGGSFSVVYDGLVGGKHRFRNTNKEWAKSLPFFDVADEDIYSKVFTVVPESDTPRKWQDEYKAERGIHPDHEVSCEACRRSGVVFAELIGPEGDSVTVVFKADDHKTPVAAFVNANCAPPDHPRRSALPKLAETINGWGGDRRWALDGGKNRWYAEGQGDVYRDLLSRGFAAHGEEAVWLVTGEWPG